MEVETAAFDHLARAPVFELQVLEPLAIRDMRRGSKRRATISKESPCEPFVPLPTTFFIEAVRRYLEKQG
jgi:hypothetical protein